MNTLRHSIKVRKCFWFNEQQVPIKRSFVSSKIELILRNIQIEHLITLGAVLFDQCSIIGKCFNHPSEEFFQAIFDFLKRLTLFPDVIFILLLTTGIFADQNHIVVYEQIIKFNDSMSDFELFSVAGRYEKPAAINVVFILRLKAASFFFRACSFFCSSVRGFFAFFFLAISVLPHFSKFFG